MKCLYCETALDETDVQVEGSDAFTVCMNCGAEGPVATIGCREEPVSPEQLTKEALQLHAEAAERIAKDRQDLVKELDGLRDTVAELRQQLDSQEDELRTESEKLSEVERLWYPVEAELRDIAVKVVDVNTDQPGGYVDVVVELRDQLLEARKQHKLGPPLVYVSNGEAGDGQDVCAGCGEEREHQHNWGECRRQIVKNENAGDSQTIAFLSRELGFAQKALQRCDSWTRVGPDGFSMANVFDHIRRTVKEVLEKGPPIEHRQSIADVITEVVTWARLANAPKGTSWDHEYVSELLDRLRDALQSMVRVYCVVGREGLENVFLSAKGAYARLHEGGTVLHPAKVHPALLEIDPTAFGDVHRSEHATLPDYRGLLQALLGVWDDVARAGHLVHAPKRLTDAVAVARGGLTVVETPPLPAGEEWSCEDCGQANPQTTYTCLNCRHLRRTQGQTPDNDTYRARELSDLAMLASALEVDDTTFMTGAHYALIPLDIAKTGLAALQRYLSRTRPDLQFELERLVAVAREELTVSQEWIERADRVLTATQRERSAEFEADLAKLTEAQRRARARGHLSPEASGGLSGTHYEVHDPVARALDEAPLDDEPVTEQERLEIDEARSEAARGLGITTSELKRRMPQKTTLSATDLPAGWRATKTGYWRSDGMRLHFDGTYWRAAKTDYVEPDYLWSDSMKAMVELNGSFPADVDTRWTIGDDNRYNTSRAFQACTSTVLKLMANHRLEDPLEPRAGMIVAQLAGIHGLRPPNAYGELAAQLSSFKNIANEVLGSKREQNVLLVWVAAKFDELVTALGG